MSWFNQSVTTESKKNINNLFFKINSINFFYEKRARATAAAAITKVDHLKRTGNGRLIKLSNDYQSIILFRRVPRLHLGVIIF